MQRGQDGSAVETFDTLDGRAWYVSDFAIGGDWIDTAWEADNVSLADGVVTLTLDTSDKFGKAYTGAEIKTYEVWGYGRYEVTMQASGEDGINSNFFTYTGEYFGEDWNEIDFEFLGKDPTKVWVNYHTANGQYGGAWVDLGFDASAGMHHYAFDWAPDSIRWYADGRLIHEVVDPALPVPDAPGFIYMNIWAGSPEWMGTPDFAGSTSASYSEVRFTPLTDETGEPLAWPELMPPDVTAWLVDADTEERLAVLEDGASYEGLAGRNLTVLVEVTGESAWRVESVRFELNGGAVARTENFEPYALFGDSGAEDLSAGPAFAAGDHALELGLYSADGATGLISTVSYGFALPEQDVAAVPPPAPEPEPEPEPKPLPVRLRLMDAATDTVIADLVDGATIDAALIAGREITLLAEVDPGFAAAGQVESVGFDLNGGAVTRIENFEPYALFGDRDGADLNGGLWLSSGAHGVSLALHDANGLGGTRLVTMEVAFEVVGEMPPPPHASEGVLTLLLADAATDETIARIREGDVLDRGLIEGRDVTFVAELDPGWHGRDSVRSVVMELNDGEARAVENTAPHALFGDRNGDLNGGGLALADGGHEFSIDLHAGRHGGGELLESMTFAFGIETLV